MDVEEVDLTTKLQILEISILSQIQGLAKMPILTPLQTHYRAYINIRK
jgi:hypothetical protein